MPLEGPKGRETSALAPTSAIVTKLAGSESACLGNSPPVSLLLIPYIRCLKRYLTREIYRLLVKPPALLSSPADGDDLQASAMAS